MSEMRLAGMMVGDQGLHPYLFNSRWTNSRVNIRIERTASDPQGSEPIARRENRNEWSKRATLFAC